MVVFQHFSPITWHVLKYAGSWSRTESKDPLPRHGAVAFSLANFASPIEKVYLGYGYLINERAPGKTIYLRELWSVSDYFSTGIQTSIQIFSNFLINTSIKSFVIGREAYLLKEAGKAGTVYAVNSSWDQRKIGTFPEETGSLAAFTIDSTGYVVNQLAGPFPAFVHL